jgi:hypothetical protein
MAADPKKPKATGDSETDDQASIQQSQSGGSSTSAADIASLVRRLGEAGGVPISLRLTEPDPIDTGRLLSEFGPVTVAFPPCAAEMLALIKINGNTNKDDIDRYFEEYFRFGIQHGIIHSKALEELDPDLLACDFEGPLFSSNIFLTRWIGDCCICSPCLTLNGNRNGAPATGISRLFVGDVVWLSFIERMGVHQILGAILDAYASNGRLPISNGSLDVDMKDDVVALVLEVMTRQVKTGMSSTVRDRASLYRTSIGWNSDPGRKLTIDTNVNSGFSTLFHKLIYHSLEFYKDKRLAVAIRGSAAPVAPPSVATLITIRDTIDVLKKRFEAFQYGRNYYNTLSGIVWTIAGMSVIRSLATTIGIPPAFGSPDEFIPAAYDILVLKRPVTSGETNRYLIHKECADKGRDILLDLEVIDHKDTTPVTGELEVWLTQIEAKIEGYRTAYRTLTGVDLGVSPNPVIEQQA